MLNRQHDEINAVTMQSVIFSWKTAMVLSFTALLGVWVGMFARMGNPLTGDALPTLNTVHRCLLQLCMHDRSDRALIPAAAKGRFPEAQADDFSSLAPSAKQAAQEAEISKLKTEIAVLRQAQADGEMSESATKVPDMPRANSEERKSSHHTCSMETRPQTYDDVIREHHACAEVSETLGRGLRLLESLATSLQAVDLAGGVSGAAEASALVARVKEALQEVEQELG